MDKNRKCQSGYKVYRQFRAEWKIAVFDFSWDLHWLSFTNNSFSAGWKECDVQSMMRFILCDQSVFEWQILLVLIHNSCDIGWNSSIWSQGSLSVMGWRRDFRFPGKIVNSRQFVLIIRAFWKQREPEGFIEGLIFVWEWEVVNVATCQNDYLWSNFQFKLYNSFYQSNYDYVKL